MIETAGLMHILNWQRFYDAAAENIKITADDGHELLRGKDYDVVDSLHNGDGTMIIAIEGRGEYAGRKYLHYDLRLENGKPKIILNHISDTLEHGTLSIPDAIKVGDALYDVVRGAVFKNPKRDFLTAGECRHTPKSEIFVSSLGDPEYERYIFLHEMCHAIIHEFCKPSPLSHDEEEDFVEAFSRGLYDVIKHNRGVFADSSPDELHLAPGHIAGI